MAGQGRAGLGGRKQKRERNKNISSSVKHLYTLKNISNYTSKFPIPNYVCLQASYICRSSEGGWDGETGETGQDW